MQNSSDAMMEKRMVVPPRNERVLYLRVRLKEPPDHIKLTDCVATVLEQHAVGLREGSVGCESTGTSECGYVGHDWVIWSHIEWLMTRHEGEFPAMSLEYQTILPYGSTFPSTEPDDSRNVLTREEEQDMSGHPPLADEYWAKKLKRRVKERMSSNRAEFLLIGGALVVALGTVAFIGLWVI